MPLQSVNKKGDRNMFNKLLLSMAMVVSMSLFSQVSFAENANFGGKSESLSPEEKFAEVKQKAESGSSKDQLSLGRMYHNGVGVAKDDAKAAEWWKKAAAQGNEIAQEALKGLKAK